MLEILQKKKQDLQPILTSIMCKLKATLCKSYEGTYNPTIKFYIVRLKL